MAEFNPDITLEEFELLCTAVSTAVENARRYVQNAPTEEDEMMENTSLTQWLELQKKFPEEQIFLKGEDGGQK